MEAHVRTMPVGRGIVAVSAGIDRSVVLLAAWHGSEGRQDRVVTTGPGDWLKAAAFLNTLLMPFEPDDDVASHLVGARKRAWTDVSGLFVPMLRDLFEGVGERLNWSVFAPGPGRLAPWAALLDEALGPERAPHATSHLPTLMWPDAPGRTPNREACLIGLQDESPVLLGAAVVATLRRLFPPDLVLGPRGPVTRPTVVEVDQLEPVAPQLGRVRVYGAGADFPITSGMTGVQLTGARMFRPQNTRGVWLPGGSEVELWAAGVAMTDLDRALWLRGDRLPALARAFLQCGASGVVDLAWPVPDVVKALVCEQYAVARRALRLDGPAALTEAVRWTRDLLRATASESPRTSQDCLRMLDRARRDRLSLVGLDGALLVPFSEIQLEGMDIRAFLDESALPVHLAAFRYWGGASSYGRMGN